MSRRRLAAVAAALVAASLLLRCGADPGNLPAIADAAPESAAPRDARPDRSLLEAAVDIPVTEPGWKWFSARGNNCTSYSVPIDPVAELPKLVWNRCFVSPYDVDLSKCSEWDRSSWGKESNPQGGAEVSLDGRYLNIAYSRESGSVVDEQESIFDRATLAPLGAIRSRWIGEFAPITCQLATSLNGFADPVLFSYSPNFGLVEGTPAQIANRAFFNDLLPEYVSKKDVANGLAFSSNVFAFTSLAGTVRVRRSDMSWVRGSRYVDRPLVIGDDVLAHEKNNAWVGIARVDADGSVVTMRSPPNRNLQDATYDGNYVYWTEQFGDPDPEALQPKLELWRTRMTRDVAAFNANAERIVEVDGPLGFAASRVYDGVYMGINPNTTLLIRIADKRVKILKRAAGTQNVWPYYADQKELWFRAEITRYVDVHYGKIDLDW